jgi:hypothetical protein
MGMYPEIAEAVASGKVLLEWDKSKGKPPAPLLKVRFFSSCIRFVVDCNSSMCLTTNE